MLRTVKVWWHCRRLRSTNSESRRAAAGALGRLGDARAVEPLIEALGDDVDGVRRAATQALVTLRAFEALIKVLGGRYGDVRRAAAEAVGRLGDARAVEPLMRALGDGDGDVRRAAADALARLGQPVWRGFVKGDQYEDFTRLGQSGDARAIEPLVKALGNYDHNVGYAAAMALGRLGDARAVEPLIGALGHYRDDVRSAAAKALGRIGGARAIEALGVALCNGWVKREAAEALAALGAVDPLIKAVGERDSDVRRTAAETLGTLGHSRAVERLINALGDPNGEVGRAAAEALGGLGDMRAVEPLAKALAGAHRDVRRSAAEALGKLGDARAVAPLIMSLGDDDGDVRRQAAEALARLGEPAWQGLVKGQYDDFTRLGDSGDARAVDPLIVALGGRGYHVRRLQAASALGMLGNARALEPLVNAMADPDHDFRQTVASALGKLGDARAIELLVRTLGDGHWRVRHAAAGALARLGDPAWQALVKGDDGDFGRLAQSSDARAVQPLLHALKVYGSDLDRSQRDTRLAAARGLAELACRAPEVLHEHWREAHELITKAHRDTYVGTGLSSDCTSLHVDEGIGGEFPAEPAAPKPEARDF